MPGLGTIINVEAIIVAGLLGSAAGKLVNEHVRDGLVKASGVCVLFIGIAGALQGMLSIDGGVLASGKSLFIMVSVVMGALAGELLDIDALVRRFGEWLKHKTGNSKDRTFVDAFVTASITVCIGAMAVVGAVEDVMMGDISLVGSILIFCVGVNLVWDTKLRVANMLPALLLAPILTFLPVTW